MNLRKRRLAGFFCAALLLGGTYAAFCLVTGLRIPCLFYRVTGLLCPGCGITRMCLALLGLDFPLALRSNALVFCLLPLFALLLVQFSRQYLKTGSLTPSRGQEAVLRLLIVLLVVFSLLRNLPGFWFLRPLP